MNGDDDKKTQGFQQAGSQYQQSPVWKKNTPSSTGGSSTQSTANSQNQKSPKDVTQSDPARSLREEGSRAPLSSHKGEEAFENPFSPAAEGGGKGSDEDELDALQREIEDLLGKLDDAEEGLAKNSEETLSPAQRAALGSIEERREASQEHPVEDEETRAEAIEKLKREIQEKVAASKEHSRGVEHTYYEDLSRAMEANDPKTMSTLIAKARREKQEKLIRSPFSKRNLFYLIGSLVLLFGIIFSLSFIFKKKEPVRYIHEKVVPALVRSEKNTGVNLAALSPEEAKQAVRKLIHEKIPKESVHQIYYVEKKPSGMITRLGVDDVFEKLEVKSPAQFNDSVYDMFMHGVYRGDENYPFLLFKVKYYDQAFDAMREWEPHMIDDLGVMLDLPDEAFDRSLLEPGFQDDVVQNKNVRVARFLPREVDRKGEVNEIYKDDEGGDDTQQRELEKSEEGSQQHKRLTAFLNSLFSSPPAYAQENTGVICRKYTVECFNLQGEQVPEPAPGTNDPTIFCTKKIDYSKAYGAEMKGKDGYICTDSAGNDVYVEDKLKGTYVICYKALFKCYDDNGAEIVSPTVEDLNNPRYTCMKFPDWKVKPVVDKTGSYRESPYWICKDYSSDEIQLGGHGEGEFSLCYPAVNECYDDMGNKIENPTDEDLNNPRYKCVRHPDYSVPPVGDATGSLSNDPHYLCYGGKGTVEESKVKHVVGSGERDKTVGDIWDMLLLYITREVYVGMKCNPITRGNCRYVDEPSITATQKFLKAAGLMDSSSPEGQLDVLTQETLRDFQTINGLNPSGVIDQQTANLIQSIVRGLAGDVTLYGGSGIAAINDYIDGTNVGLSAYNEDVQALQIFLYAEGYPIPQIDGFFDRDTLEALQQFQRDHNLPVTTGEPGDMKINDETLNLINGMIQEKNYLGSGFELKDGKLVGTGVLEGKFGPGFVGEKVFADEFKKGDTVLMYTFIDEHTLLITTHESVIKEIIKRLALSDLFKEKPAS